MQNPAGDADPQKRLTCMIRNRAQNAAGWDLDKLTAILIRQFKRLLAERDVALTEADILRIAEASARRDAPDALTRALIDAMRAIVAESHARLAEWGMTYAQSLATPMDAMPGWETTAEFLQLANEKGNAELRISAGASLLALLGDPVAAPDLLSAWEHGKDDPEDVDAVIARRALAFVSRTDPAAPDWSSQARAWVQARSDE